MAIVETLLIKKTVDLLWSAVDFLFGKSRLAAAEKESGKLITEAIRELLSVDPNIHKARSQLRLAEKTWPNPSEELYRAQEILESVSVSNRKKTVIGRKKVSKKKVKKKAVKKKAKKK